MLKKIYERLPSSVQPLAKQSYESLFNKKISEEAINACFSSKDDYKHYVSEFESSGVEAQVETSVKKFRGTVTDERGVWAGIGLKPSKFLYALIREHKPDRIVETGVCNGVSTLIILAALDQNGSGECYSIDYPMYADESLPEFRKTAYPAGHDFSAIPADKEPGWIIPDELTANWELRIGKSQRRLPELVVELGELDMFLHDSEHTHPCMMFEYEIVWEWLSNDGILLSDDIEKNDVFDVFTNTREPREHGNITDSTGFVLK